MIILNHKNELIYNVWQLYLQWKRPVLVAILLNYVGGYIIEKNLHFILLPAYLMQLFRSYEDLALEIVSFRAVRRGYSGYLRKWKHAPWNEMVTSLIPTRSKEMFLMTKQTSPCALIIQFKTIGGIGEQLEKVWSGCGFFFVRWRSVTSQIDEWWLDDHQMSSSRSNDWTLHIEINHCFHHLKLQ